MARARILILAVFALQALGLGSLCLCASAAAAPCPAHTESAPKCCHGPDAPDTAFESVCCDTEPTVQPASLVASEMLLKSLQSLVATPVLGQLPEPQTVVQRRHDDLPQLKPSGPHLQSPSLRAPPASGRV